MTDSALTLSEAAQILSIHKQSLYNLRKQGLIKAVRVSPRRTVILRSELERYLKSLPGATPNVATPKTAE